MLVILIALLALSPGLTGLGRSHGAATTPSSVVGEGVLASVSSPLAPLTHAITQLEDALRVLTHVPKQICAPTLGLNAISSGGGSATTGSGSTSTSTSTSTASGSSSSSSTSSSSTSSAPACVATPYYSQIQGILNTINHLLGLLRGLKSFLGKVLAIPGRVAGFLTHLITGITQGVGGFLTSIARAIGGLARGLNHWLTGIIDFLDRAFGVQPGGSL